MSNKCLITRALKTEFDAVNIDDKHSRVIVFFDIDHPSKKTALYDPTYARSIHDNNKNSEKRFILSPLEPNVFPPEVI